MTQQAQVATAPTQTPFDNPMLPARVILPVLVITGYVAFLVTGFGTSLQAAQPLPVYAFFGLCLIALQGMLAETRSAQRIVYAVLTSAFALVYAADITFNNARHGHFTREPLTYVVLNLLLVAVFFADAVTRRQQVMAQSAQTRAATEAAQPVAIAAPFSYQAFAADFAGLSILFYVAAGLLQILHNIGIVTVDLNPTLGLHLPDTVRLLPDLDQVIALACAGITLLLLGIIGVVAIATNQSGQIGSTKDSAAVRGFGTALMRVTQSAFGPVLLSLRLVLGPLVWLGSALAIARAAVWITEYLNSSALSTGNWVSLFNPFSHNSVTRYGQGLSTIGLMLLAIATVILSVAIVEHDGAIIARTLDIFASVGRALSLTLAFFTFSLACVNAVVNYASPVKNEPFQVGAFTIVALLAGITFAVYAAVAERGKAGA